MICLWLSSLHIIDSKESRKFSKWITASESSHEVSVF